MIKVSHEMPICLMQNGYEEAVNDYAYALVHLFETHTSYYNHFVATLKNGREVILDNSIFELEAAFDADRFVYWLRKLGEDSGKPELITYIIPDVLDNTQATLDSLAKFQSKFGKLPGKSMAVAQGTSLLDLQGCFIAMKYRVDIIGISFNCEAYNAFRHHPFFHIPAPKNGELTDEYAKLYTWKKGRQLLIEMLYHDGQLENTQVHLLGCSLPDEFNYYTSEHPALSKYIVSLDTSNPVVHGLLNIPYNDTVGLVRKESIKLANMIDYNIEDISPEIDKVLRRNVDLFRAINDL